MNRTEQCALTITGMQFDVKSGLAGPPYFTVDGILAEPKVCRNGCTPGKGFRGAFRIEQIQGGYPI